MFDWVVDGIRYIGWIIYAGMNYFVSSIYNVLISIPNNLASILNNETVNTLFNASRNLFFIFVSLMIAVMVLSRLFDWNINKMMSQMKKIFLLCLILISLPWIFNQALKITNGFIAGSDNVMISEQNDTQAIDLGVNLANVYIYKNKQYENSDEYGKYDDNPFAEQVDITNSEIINQKIKNEKGKEVYLYSYLNPILGLIINIMLIGLLVLTAFKVYGYLYNIIVIKIWIPIKMIYDGFNDTPVSEAVYEIISAFTSFAIQLVIIPFSVVMLDIFSSQVGDNIFLQLVSVFVALWFMFTGVDYIQSKFQGKSGIPTVLEAYSFMKLTEAGVNTVKSIIPSGTDKDNYFEQAGMHKEEDINTGRDNDINSSQADNDDFINSEVADNETSNENQEANDFATPKDINSMNGNDDVSKINENNNSEAIYTDEQDLNNMNNTFDNDDYYTGNTEDSISNSQLVSDNDNVMLNKDEINNKNEDNTMKGLNNDVVESNNGYNFNGANSNGINSINHDNTTGTGDINISDNDNISFPATNKQVEYAKSLGISPEGKNKYELGREIEQIRNGEPTNYTEPTWEKVDIDENNVVSVEELENLMHGTRKEKDD